MFQGKYEFLRSKIVGLKILCYVIGLSQSVKQSAKSCNLKEETLWLKKLKNRLTTTTLRNWFKFARNLASDKARDPKVHRPTTSLTNFTHFSFKFNTSNFHPLLSCPNCSINGYTNNGIFFSRIESPSICEEKNKKKRIRFSTKEQ